MNRRSFLGLLAAVPLAAAAQLKEKALPSLKSIAQLTFRGAPVTYDEHCYAARIYFVNPANFELRPRSHGVIERVYGR